MASINSFITHTSMTCPIIVIATVNSEKARQIKIYLEALFKIEVAITSFFDKSIVKDRNLVDTVIKELSSLRASSSEELALLKAKKTAQMLSLHAIAEETLLVVPSLGSEHDAFQEKIDTSRHQTLLLNTQDRIPSFENKLSKTLPDTQSLLRRLALFDDPISRSAYLTSTLAFASPDTTYCHTAQARLEGYIADTESGSSNYDFGSVFIKHEYSKTISDLPQSVYHRISHRRKVTEKMYAFLAKALSSFSSSQPSL